MKIINNLNKNVRGGFTPTPISIGVSLQSKRGFTLLEILLVVATIGILASIVIFAINPGKQLADTRNAQRKVDVNTILNAIKQYQIDNRGDLPSEGYSPTITADDAEICRTDANDCSSLIDMTDLTLNGKYLVSIPIDPSDESIAGTGYLVKLTGNRVTVSAPNAENGIVISVTN